MRHVFSDYIQPPKHVNDVSWVFCASSMIGEELEEDGDAVTKYCNNCFPLSL